MPTLVKLPPDDKFPDPRMDDPEKIATMRPGVAALETMAGVMRADIKATLQDRLSTAALAAALMEKRPASERTRAKNCKKGPHREALEKSEEIAVLFGWCLEAAPEPQLEKKRAAERVRNEVKWACEQCGCRAGHQGCPETCALKLGRELLASLLNKTKKSVSDDEFGLAFDAMERIR